jgi:hypothetical protein
MTMKTTNRIILAILLLGLIGFLGSNITFLLLRVPFAVPDSESVTQTAVIKQLNTMAPKGELQPGAIADIGVLRTNDGRQITIKIAEGKFLDNTIEPTQSWSELLGKPTLLVSSADEHLRNDGGISRPIGAGCSIKEVDFTIPIGEAYATACVGPYKQAFPQITDVANVIIVAWSGVEEKANCKFDLDAKVEPSQAGYTQCIRKAIQDSLLRMFTSTVKRFDTVVIPALGTGTGRLSKGQFYDAATNALANCLSTLGCDQKLPRSIVFSIWVGDVRENGWPEVRDAIARNVVKLGSDVTSHYAPVSPIEKQARYIGILAVLFIFVVLLCSRRLLPEAINKLLPDLDGISLWLIIVGWFFVAAGAFSVLSDFAELHVSANDPHAFRDLALNGAFGVIAAICCTLINKATKLFQDTNLGWNMVPDHQRDAVKMMKK